jgi:hypothetical protein
MNESPCNGTFAWKPLMRPCLVAAALAAVLLAQPAHSLPSSFLPDGTVLHGGKPFFPLGLYAENGVNPWDVVPVRSAEKVKKSIG